MLKSKQITEGAILAAIYIVLLLISFFLPLIGTITLFILPTPFIIYTYKHGLKPALVMSVATILLSLLLTNIYSLPISITTAMGGVTIGVALFKQRSPYDTLARGTAGFTIGFVIALLLTQVVMDVNIAQEIEQQTTFLMEQFEKIVGQMGVEDEVAEQLDLLEEQMEMMVNLLPLMLVMSGLLFAFISQWIAYKMINRLDQKKYYFPPFRKLTFPTAVLWIYFIALLMTLIQSDPEGTLFIVVQNIYLLVGMLMFIQGMTFVMFYAHHKKMAKAVPVTVLIIFCVIMAPIAFPLLRILGIIDIGFKLRERMSAS